MVLWSVICLMPAGIVLLLDYLFRRKKWEDNTNEEKISLIVNMIAAGVHLYLSIWGVFWPLIRVRPETAFGNTLFNTTLILAITYFIVAIVVTITAPILRKTGKIKASIWINIIALVYISLVLLVSYLTVRLL